MAPAIHWTASTYRNDHQDLDFVLPQLKGGRVTSGAEVLRGDSATGTSVPIPLNRKLVNGFVRKQREPALQDIYP